jgi:type III pantothenate kinase
MTDCRRLLLIDIGNTNIVIGVLVDGALSAHWRLTSSNTRTIDESWVMLCTLFGSASLDIKSMDGVAISSVVPDLTFVWEKLSEHYLNLPPCLVDHRLKGVPDLQIGEPSTVGADRICNSVAAWYYTSQPSIVIDFGTATTFDIVGNNGDFLGGVILPGLQTAHRNLHQSAAKLPKVELVFPDKVIGDSTETALQSGILHGTLAQIEGLVLRIRQEMKQRGVVSDVRVLSTGGFGRMMVRRSSIIDVHLPFLVLFGLALLYERSQGCSLGLDSSQLEKLAERG